MLKLNASLFFLIMLLNNCLALWKIEKPSLHYLYILFFEFSYVLFLRAQPWRSDFFSGFQVFEPLATLRPDLVAGFLLYTVRGSPKVFGPQLVTADKYRHLDSWKLILQASRRYPKPRGPPSK